MYEKEKNKILARFDENSEKVIKCHDGWMPLILDLDLDIADIAPNYKITTIKEKYGLLNFYVTNVPDDVYVEVYDLIADAEDRSANVCEMCGKRGLEGVLEEWWSIRCQNCAPPNWRSWRSIKEKYGID